MTWFQPEKPDRAAAVRGDDGRIILAFGKHEGRALRDLPTRYLKWLTRGNGYVPEELQSLAGNIIRDRAGGSAADAGAWYSMSRNRYQVAHRDEDTGAVLLDFGKYEGRALTELSERYLSWMVSRAGRAFLPAGLRDLAACELRRRIDGAVADRTPEITIDGRDFIEWAHTATAAEMQGVLNGLRTYATVLDSTLGARADTLLKGLFHED